MVKNSSGEETFIIFLTILSPKTILKIGMAGSAVNVHKDQNGLRHIWSFQIINFDEKPPFP